MGLVYTRDEAAIYSRTPVGTLYAIRTVGSGGSAAFTAARVSADDIPVAGAAKMFEIRLEDMEAFIQKDMKDMMCNSGVSFILTSLSL